MTPAKTFAEQAFPVERSETSAITAPTQFVETRLETYAYRRFGHGTAPPLVCLQHFTGTLDNWDPAVADPLPRDREVILLPSNRGRRVRSPPVASRPPPRGTLR